jgi:hypothetical protein
MSAGGSCAHCGAVLASDQEYCLDCGERRPRSPHSPWRTPLIAAMITAVLALAVMLFAYERMRDDAEGEANGDKALQGRVTKPAPASARAAAPGAAQQPSPGPSAAAPSP